MTLEERVEALRAKLSEDERVARAAGEARIAWLTYRDDEGQMLYTTVAAESGDAWIAAGHEVPAPSSVLIVYDPTRVLAEVEYKRWLLEQHYPVLNHIGLVCARCSDLSAAPGRHWVGAPCEHLTRLLKLYGLEWYL